MLLDELVLLDVELDDVAVELDVELVVTVLLVVTGGQVPASHVPGPTSMPPCPAQSTADTRTH